MAYNPTIYNPYGTTYGQPQYPQIMPQTQQPQEQGLRWVDGEVGAKAYQIPQGWPANTPIALWDTNDTIIYLKSANPMGIPNPLQKLCYRIESPQQSGVRTTTTASLMSGDDRPDMSEYVRKDELKSMKDELVRTIQEMGRTPAKHAAKEEDE